MLYDNLETLVGECLQYVKKSTNEMEKNAVAVVRTYSHCEEELVDHVQLNISMAVSMFLSLPHCSLDICNWETRQPWS